MNYNLIKQYWQSYLQSTPNNQVIDAHYLADQFGDNSALADELGELVVKGIKTATCFALWEWEAEGSALPEVGLKTIVLNSKKEPICIIETTEVTIKAFKEVDEKFAYDEGEGDRSLEFWRSGHWQYFSRVLPLIGKQATPEMLLVCERFRLVYK